jgi:hypothetical protein
MAEQSVTRSASGKSSSQRKSEPLRTSYAGKGSLQQTVNRPSKGALERMRDYSEAQAQRVRAATNAGTIDIRGYLGDERTGIRKTVAGARKPAAPVAVSVVPASQVISNVTRERTSPVPSRPAAPARMATNPVTGKTTGFTSGSKTGSTVTKAGTAFKTAESAYQRQQRMALEKMGVAGPRGGASKTSSSGGGMRSTGGGSRSSGGGAVGSTSGTRGYGSGGNVGRGDVGAGRRGGGR